MACASCRARSARRCSKSIRSAARSTTSPTIRARASGRRAQLQQWRDDIDAIYRGSPPARLAGLAQAVRRFDLAREDFIAIIDGMEMDVVDDIRAPDRADARPLLRPRRLRGRPAVGAGVRHGAGAGPRAGASSRARAAAHQYSARSRRGRGNRAALSAARGAARRRDRDHGPGAVLAHPSIGEACATVVAMAKSRVSRPRRRSWRAARAAW